MKKYLKLIMIFMLMIPVLVKADMKVTYDESRNAANNYISKYKDKNKYFVFPSKYVYSSNGQIVEDSFYVNGGLLSYYEYNKAGSYLATGKEYWLHNKYTVDYTIKENTASGYKAATRVTEYVKPGTRIEGKGSYADPFVFADGYYIDIIPNSKLYGTVTPLTQMVRSGETATINIVAAEGFEYKGNDDCGLTRVGSTNRYTITNVSKDVSCVISFEAKTYEINLTSSQTYNTSPSPSKLYYRPGKGFYSDSALTNKVTQLTTLPKSNGYEFEGFKYNGNTVITASGAVQESIPGLNSSNLSVNLNASFKNAQLMAGEWDSENSTYLRTTIAKKDIEKITFTNSFAGHTANGTDCWDVSKENNGTVLAWATDSDNNGLYELTIGSNGKVYASNGSYLFCYLSNLKSFVGMQYFDTSLMTSMASMFHNCKSLSSVDLSYFDTSKVTFMYGVFRGSGLVTIDLSHFDTSKVNTLSYLFQDCTKLQNIIGIEKLDTSREDYFAYMFDGCSSLTSIDLSHFNTSKATSMAYMFRNCDALTTLDLSSFDTSKVTDMHGMFQWSNNIESINLSSFNTSKVTDMGAMFDLLYELKSLDITHFDTSNVTNMASMFDSCRSLTTLDLSHINTSKVTNMNNMFWGCSGLSNIDLSHFDTRNVTGMAGMFGFCSGLTSIDLSPLNTSKVTNMSRMFESCTKLTSIDLSPLDTSKVTNMSSMFSGVQVTSIDLSPLDTSNVEYYSAMFQLCDELTEIDVSGFNTSNGVDFTHMFSAMYKLRSLDVSNFNTSKATGMSGMFGQNYALTSLTGLNHFDTSKVTKFDGMFAGLRLQTLDLSSFDTSSATCMGGTASNTNVGMFESGSFKTLDLSTFDTSKVDYMGRMFYDCKQLETIYVGNKFTVKSGAYTDRMFGSATKLKGGSGTTYNSSYIDGTYARIDGGTSNPGYFTRR